MKQKVYCVLLNNKLVEFGNSLAYILPIFKKRKEAKRWIVCRSYGENLQLVKAIVYISKNEKRTDSK